MENLYWKKSGGSCKDVSAQYQKSQKDVDSVKN